MADAPTLWKLAPAAVPKPWGLVHGTALDLTGIEVGVGELWLASAQTGAGNYSTVVADPPLRKTLAALLAEAADDGRDALAQLLGPTALDHLRANPHRGKSEAWHIRAAVGRVGVVAGPRTQEDAQRLQSIIMQEGLEPRPERWSDEVRELFGVIEPLRGGETFLALAGALHTMFAIGPGSVLVIDEIQQGYGEALLPTLTKILMVQNDVLSVQVHPDGATVAAAAEGRLKIEQDLQANPTVRVYDFGRRPGEYPELGFRLVRPEAGLRRVPPVKVTAAEGRQYEALVADPHFVKARHTLRDGAVCGLGAAYGSYHVLHCLEGAVTLDAGSGAMAVRRGETVLVPGCFETALRMAADGDAAVFDDSLPSIPALEEFLVSHGATETDVRALLDPPRAR